MNVAWLQADSSAPKAPAAASSTAAAPSYPTDMGASLGANTQSQAPTPPPPSAPKHEHHEYHKRMQQRHRERLSSHKDQVPISEYVYYVYL